MKASPNDTVPQEPKPILQLERPLLSIDKYAARKGVSIKVVEEYGRLGIVQIRKHKGKRYVVDVPLSPYHPAFERVYTLQESHKMVSQATEKHRQPVEQKIRSSKFEIRNSAGHAPSGAAKPIRPNIEPPKPKMVSAFAKNIFCKASKIKNQIVGKIKRDANMEQARSQRAWQVMAVSLIVCLFVALIACLWLYMNQKVHRGKLDQAYASIQNVYDDFVRTSQQIATLQSKLVESTAELELVKNELNISKAEAASLRSELTQVKVGLDTIQRQNTAALEQLKEQLAQLTTQLGKFIKSNQTLSESSNPGK